MVVTRYGIVATSHVQASVAGAQILARGGSAVDAAIADRWGFLAAQSKRKGRPLAIIDGFLAATALHQNLTIVSRNSRDFRYTQVPVLNPWEA